MKQAAATGLTISLADCTRWLIRGGDVQAKEIVSALGAAMSLQPGSTGRELLAVVREKGGMVPINLNGPGPALCVLPPLMDDDMLTVGMSRLALVIAQEAQSRGGLLVHGALAGVPFPHTVAAGRVAPTGGTRARPQHSAELDSRTTAGILLAGPGTVGKSTASRRLPLPWRALCDDTALVVCSPEGRYWAHPWPTWSRFYNYGIDPPPGGSWDVQQAVPLQAIFFLSQSPDDRVDSLSVTQATAMLMEAVHHVSRPMERHLTEAEVRALHREQMAAAEALARAVPAYRLYFSLNGAFWVEIERVLAETPSPRSSPLGGEGVTPLSLPGRGVGGEGGAAPTDSHPDDDTLHVVYTGISMKPTLIEPELLEVVPYGRRSLRPGDVVYFRPPEGQKELVHRVVAVTSSNARPPRIQTRGDNNPSADPYLLGPADVIGRVVAAQRGSRRRRILGGLPGVVEGTTARQWGHTNRGIARLLHSAYRVLARSGLFRRLLPASLRPRIYFFQARRCPFYKLMVGGRVVGQYDIQQQEWHIDRPFRLFVDEAALPAPEAGQGLAPGKVPTRTGSTEPRAKG